MAYVWFSGRSPGTKRLSRLGKIFAGGGEGVWNARVGDGSPASRENRPKNKNPMKGGPCVDYGVPPPFPQGWRLFSCRGLRGSW